MPAFTLDMFQTAGVATLLFVLGRFLTNRIEFLKRCCIPAPVVGGLIFALVHLALYAGGILQLTFDDNVKDFFMTLFFTSVGYTACFRLLKKGGKKVFVFLGIAILMVVMQNVLSSVLTLTITDWDPRLGLCTGSIPMVGGHGTAGSYGNTMEKELFIEGAKVLAMASATFGATIMRDLGLIPPPGASSTNTIGTPSNTPNKSCRSATTPPTRKLRPNVWTATPLPMPPSCLSWPPAWALS